jgi:integrase
MDPVVVSERALDGGGAVKDPNEGPLSPMRPTSISYVVYKLCDKASIRIDGIRDIRRSFMTMIARAVRDNPVGNARDVQQICGHRSLETTQRFMDADWDAQTRAIGSLFDPK